MLVAGVVAVLALRGGDYVVPGSGESPSASGSSVPAQAPGVDPAGAARSLGALVSSLDDRDPEAAAEVGDDASAGLLRAVVANASALDVRDLSMRYVDETTGSTGGSWQAAVDLTYRFAGFDEDPVSQEVQVGFRASGDRVAITGLGGGDRRTPLWLTGALEVRRTATTLVAVAGTAQRADDLSARAVAAVRVVRQVLPTWTGGLVVEAPSSLEQLDAVLDAEAGTYDAAAAVTASVDGSLTAGTPVHVFVNPAVYDGLDPVGAQVVMSHEATHVATDAPLRSLPPWLVEGFADYVALRDVDLPITTTAGQVIDEVRQDGLPDALPDTTDFDEGSDYFGAAYEASWLVCRVIADRDGEAALVSLYTRVSDGESLGAALRATTGRGVGALTRAWRGRLRDLAG